MRTIPRAGLVGLAAAASLAFGTSAARATAISATAAGDPETTYTIAARTLTVTSSDPVVLEFVRGAHVSLACYTKRGGLLNGWGGDAIWGRAASSVTVRMEAPAPRQLTRCQAFVVGGGRPQFATATLFSQAGLTPAWRRRLASTPSPGPFLARQQLAEDWSALYGVLPARDFNRQGQPSRLPSARNIVRALNRRLGPPQSSAGLLYTATLDSVGVPGVPYVVGEGTGSRTLELAVIGLDGKRYALHLALGAKPRSQFGPA
jgi:hypothetical protein